MNSSQSEQQPIVLQHSKPVQAVAFSPDGERIATGSTGVDDKNAVIWNASNGELIHKLRGHSIRVSGVAWSPSGEHLMTGSDYSARIWRSDSGLLIAVLEDSLIYGIAWCPTGELVATAGTHALAKIWRASTSELFQTTPEHSQSVDAVAFSPDGRFIITGSSDKIAIISTVIANSTPSEPTKPLHVLVGHSDSVNTVAWSPKGDLIATGSNDKTIRLWEAVTGNVIRTLTRFSKVLSVDWSPNGDFLLSGSVNDPAIIWSAATGEILQTFAHHSEAINAVAWSTRGDCIATASYDRTAQIIPITLLSKEEKKATENVTEDSKTPPNPPIQQGGNATNDNNDHSKSPPNSPKDAIFNAAVHSSRRPPSRCFKRSEQLPFRAALTRLLQLRDLPKDRPDLKEFIPDDDDIETTLVEVDIMHEEVQRRPNANKLIQDHGLTSDEVKAIICYTMDHPYKVYQWLNAFLMVNRRNATVVDHVGPFFILLYRGMEKLPRLKVRASRGVLVKDIEALRYTFDDHKNRCEKGSPLSFWGVTSFSTEDQVSTNFAGSPDEDAIVYTCGDLECVSIREFSDNPEEEEVQPLPPALFEVHSTAKVGKKLVIGMDQKDHHGVAYVEPRASKKDDN